MNKKISRFIVGAPLIVSLSSYPVLASVLPEHESAAQESISAIKHDQHGSNITASALQRLDDEKAPKSAKATPLARALAQSSNKLSADSYNVDKILTLDVSELRDNSGLVYIGGKVSDADLSRYLAHLKSELGDEQYTIYREHQAARDHQSFHVTLINPYEYQTIDKRKLKLSQKFRVTLHGLGMAKKDDKSSYFVVASSADGQFIRQNLLLNNKDFHVTLGFYPDDVFGVSKGRDTLIKK